MANKEYLAPDDDEEFDEDEFDFNDIPGYKTLTKIWDFEDKLGDAAVKYYKEQMVPTIKETAKKLKDAYSPKLHKTGDVIQDNLAAAIALGAEAWLNCLYHGLNGSLKALEASYQVLDKAFDTYQAEKTKVKSVSKKVTTTLTNVKKKITPKRVGATGQNAMAGVNKNDKPKDNKSEGKVKEFK